MVMSDREKAKARMKEGARQANERTHQHKLERGLDAVVSILKESTKESPKEVLSLKEAAEFIGVHENTMRRYAQTSDDLKCRKESGRWFFTRRALLEWIEEQ